MIRNFLRKLFPPAASAAGSASPYFSVDAEPLNSDLDDELYFAAHDGNAKKVGDLIHQGANVNAHFKHGSGWTPLHMAAIMGHSDVILLLIANGANIEATGKLDPNRNFAAGIKDASYWTPLMAVYSKPDIIKLLIDAGADVNQRSANKGHSVLHLACGYDSPGSVINLLRLGACQTIKCHEGKTPYDLAVQNSSHAAVDAWNGYVASEKARLVINESLPAKGLRPL